MRSYQLLQGSTLRRSPMYTVQQDRKRQSQHSVSQHEDTPWSGFLHAISDRYRQEGLSIHTTGTTNRPPAQNLPAISQKGHDGHDKQWHTSLEGEVDVVTTTVSIVKADKHGKKRPRKVKVLIGIEKKGGGAARSYVKVIGRASARKSKSIYRQKDR